MQATPRIVGVIPGDPFDRVTWSGASHHLFTALDRKGALAGAVDARPHPALDYVAKVAAFSPRGMRRWKERYEYSHVTRAGLSVAGGRRARRVNSHPDALLQVGAWYDFARFPGLKPSLRSSYHDANLALYAREWIFVEDVGARHIRRTMAAERRLFDRLDVIMAMSDWLRRSFIEDFDQDPGKVVTVGAGANIPRLPDVPERDWERPRLLFIGLEWERKGGPTLLAAFRGLRAERPDAELWIVGRERPAGTADDAGVTWMGRINRRTPGGDAEMARLHREATAYVMPSLFDPFPNVFLEAMAWGLPCVGADRCSMPEVIQDGVTGLIAPAGDADALAERLLTLAGEPERASRMGAAGRERFLEHFTWDRVADKMVGEISARLG